LTHSDEEKKPAQDKSKREYESCPHCGQALSPWQQVLLKVDRGLVCRKCWYRILLDAPETPPNEKRDSFQLKKDQQ
jgi:DNA-directed RNA polymerase subunit RPC12/RpoP